MKQEKRFTEPGTPQPDSKYHIDILENGPYLVYGNPPLQQEILVLNEEKIPWGYVRGREYPMEKEPTALCRCGRTKDHPYCDGTHAHVNWDSRLTADNIPLLEKADLHDGPAVQLTDNTAYCASVRICMAHQTVWENVRHSDNPEARDIAVHETILCPSGRLKIWDKEEEAFVEPPLQPAISLIEDPQKECSGPLWVKGGIPINGTDGTAYEQRNRVTLCRCGASTNKPFCDGSHIAACFLDHLSSDSGMEGDEIKPLTETDT